MGREKSINKAWKGTQRPAVVEIHHYHRSEGTEGKALLKPMGAGTIEEGPPEEAVGTETQQLPEMVREEQERNVLASLPLLSSLLPMPLVGEIQLEATNKETQEGKQSTQRSCL